MAATFKRQILGLISFDLSKFAIVILVLEFMVKRRRKMYINMSFDQRNWVLCYLQFRDCMEHYL